MKKNLLMLLIAGGLALPFLSGCGNRAIFDTAWNFSRAYLIIGDEHFSIDIQSWRDFDGSDMIQITSTDGNTYLTHSSNVIMVQER